jgi:hypothetical protein
MKWALVVHLFLNGQSHTEIMGYMTSEDNCAIAGAGTTMVYQATTAGLMVSFECLPLEEGHGA